MYKEVNAQPDFATQEEEVLQYWEEKQIYNKCLDQNKNAEPYVIYDGPPTANAYPPLHSATPMVFKDLVGRYKTMQGFYVRRQNGWDTHGLPVEVQVEKAMGLAGKKEILNLVPGDERASIQKFNQACRDSVWEYKKQWDKFLPRVGYWADIDNPYITYDSAYIEGVWGTLKEIWDQGLVYQGYKVIPYCPRCGTALSAAEVAQGYMDVHDTSVFVAFPFTDMPNRSFLAWTTTPWTLPGNVALVVGKKIDYVVIEIKNESGDTREYVLAKDRLSVVRQEYVILEELKGADLIGKSYLPPFRVFSGQYKDLYKVVAGDFVTTEDGSGIVHAAVMYGEDDYSLSKIYDLPTDHTVGLDGYFLENVPSLAGKYIRDVEGEILGHLKEQGRLFAKQSVTHSYPHCWRCKTALIYYAKDSWFISMSSKRDELVKSNNDVQWFPEHIKEGRFGDFIREARDWAISRERFWGTPLPVWISKSGKMICVGSFAELKKYAKDPSLITDEFDPHRPYVDDIILLKDGEEYYREPVVMDVWFDSGAMPFASKRDAQGEFPADYICEAIDQTRGWFNSLLSISTLIRGKSSYKRVTCIGHLVDEKGRKMSKSVGNILDPWETFKICGMDAIRWFIYTVNSPGETKSFGIKDLKTKFRKSILLLWNVFNYFVTYANLNQQDSPDEKEISELKKSVNNPLDQWMWHLQDEKVAEVTKYLEEYDFMRAGRVLEEYLNDISTWYVRRSRGRTDRAFFVVLYDVLWNYVHLTAPMTPFVSESVYQVLKRSTDVDSIHLRPWPKLQPYKQKEVAKLMQTIRQLVEVGLAVRSAAGIKVRQPLSDVYVQLDDADLGAALEKDAEMQGILLEELNVLNFNIVSTIEPGLPSKEGNGFRLALNPEISDELATQGLAREFLRQIQNMRKRLNFKPGERALLLAGPDYKDLIESLIKADSQITEKSFMIIDDKQTWKVGGEEELNLDNEIMLIGLKRL